MRLIGTLPTEADARRLCDYLLTQRIDAHAEEQASDGAWQIWIEHDDHLDAGKAELEQFRQTPNDPKYGSAAATAKKLRDVEAKEAARRRENFRDVRTNWAQNAMGRYATPVALVLIFACLIIGAVSQFRMGPLAPWMFFGVNEDAAFEQIRAGQVWRVVTPIFLHGGILHLAFNMMWLWRFGQVIESAKGSWHFIVLVLTIAILSNTLQAWWSGPFFGGMSGVVGGLLGYAWMKGKFQPYERIGITEQEVGLMIGWFVICSIGILPIPIANAAHWGGLAVGMAFGVGPYVWQRYLRRGRAGR